MKTKKWLRLNNFDVNFFFIYTGSTNEPPLPRRKKCPELAYRTNEFIPTQEPKFSERNDTVNRARVSFFNCTVNFIILYSLEYKSSIDFIKIFTYRIERYYFCVNTFFNLIF